MAASVPVQRIIIRAWPAAAAVALVAILAQAPPARATDAQQLSLMVNRVCRDINEATSARDVQIIADTFFQYVSSDRSEAEHSQHKYEADEANLASLRQLLNERRARSNVGHLQATIETDKQVLADLNAQRQRINANGVNGGPSLDVINRNIAAGRDLERWERLRSALIAARAPLDEEALTYGRQITDLQRQLAAAQTAFAASTVQLNQQIQEYEGRVASDREALRPNADASQARQVVATCERRRLAQLSSEPSVEPGAQFAGAWLFRGIPTARCSIQLLGNGQIVATTEQGVSARGSIQSQNSILVNFPFGTLIGTLVDARTLHWSNGENWLRP